MIVPPSALPAQTGSLVQDNQQKPSQALLLMAAAQMHQMGRLHGHHGRPSDPKAAMRNMTKPPSEDESA